MQRDPTELIGAVLSDTYKIERVIGHGGMGVVYEASHLRLPRRFAVKVLYAHVARDPEVNARFRREAMVTSEIGNSHIIEIVDFNQTPEGTLYIVMELLRGEDLESLLRREGPLPVERAVQIARQVASALKAAHERGVIHRDLKPSNVFLCANDEQKDFVKVLDFGISKVQGSSTVVTQDMATIGTPAYMAPEQADGKSAEADARSDIYALGTMLYEMLGGRPPFAGESILAMLYKVVNEEPPPLSSLRPGLPEPLVGAIHQAINKKPEERFATMTVLADVLDRAQSAPPPLRKRRPKAAPPAAVAPTALAPAPGDIPPTRPVDVPPTAQVDVGSLPTMQSQAAAPAAPSAPPRLDVASLPTMQSQAAAPAAPKEPPSPAPSPTMRSTLSAATGELSAAERAPKRSRLPLVLLGGLGAIVLGAGVATALMLVGRSETRPATVGQPDSAAARDVAPVRPDLAPPDLAAPPDAGLPDAATAPTPTPTPKHTPTPTPKHTPTPTPKHTPTPKPAPRPTPGRTKPDAGKPAPKKDDWKVF